jgi:hypothetical protein
MNKTLHSLPFKLPPTLHGRCGDEAFDANTTTKGRNQRMGKNTRSNSNKTERHRE